MVCLSYINVIFADDESENIDFNEVNKVIETTAKVEDLPKINNNVI